ERELAGLGGRLEHQGIKAELPDEPICEDAAEVSTFVEKPASLGALPSFHYQLPSSGIQPSESLSYPLFRAIRAEGAGVLLAELKLHFESARSSHFQYFARFKRHVRETLPALDSRETYIGAEVQVSWKAVLRHRNFERASSGDRRHSIFSRRADLAPCRVFIGHHPASHGYFQNGHQVRALFQVALQGRGIVTGVERAG